MTARNTSTFAAYRRDGSSSNKLGSLSYCSSLCFEYVVLLLHEESMTEYNLHATCSHYLQSHENTFHVVLTKGTQSSYHGDILLLVSLCSWKWNFFRHILHTNKKEKCMYIKIPVHHKHVTYITIISKMQDTANSSVLSSVRTQVTFFLGTRTTPLPPIIKWTIIIPWNRPEGANPTYQ